MSKVGASALQIAVFLGLTLLIALPTCWKVHGKNASRTSEHGTTRNVDARAAIVGLIYGVTTYGIHHFILYGPGMIDPGETVYTHFGMPWLHNIDVMAIVLAKSVLVGLLVNRFVFGSRALFIFTAKGRALHEAEAT
jgi:hypothetical protein